MKKCVLMLLLVTALFMVFPIHPAQGASGKIQFGNISIVPSLGIQSVYDTNIYSASGKEFPGDPVTTEAERKVSDWITHITPGLLFDYAFPGRGSLSLGYRGDYAFYHRQTSNNWKNNSGFLNLDYVAPSGIILGISETYTKSEDPYGGADQYNIGRVTKRSTNSLAAKAGFHLTDNFRMLLLFNNYYQKYDNDLVDFSQDYYTIDYGLSVETRILPRMWGFVRYLYGQQPFFKNAPGQTDEFNSDFKRHSVQTGLAWDPGGKWSGEANIGYQWQKYDHEFVDAAHTARRADESTWTAATNVNFQATTTTMLSLNLTRAVRNTASNTVERFVDTGIGMNLQQLLFQKLTLSAGIFYSKNEYNLPANDPRTDNNYRANLSLAYKILDWLNVGVGYGYNRKNSNIETNEFADNTYNLTVTGTF